MKAIAPAKLIITGEHSVVYGAPALAVTLDCTLQLRATPSQAFSVQSAHFPAYELTPADLPSLISALDARFDTYARGDIIIDDVLHHPAELLLYSLASLGAPTPCTLNVSTAIPISAGLGSSASLIAAAVKLAEYQTGNTLDHTACIHTVRHCERLQHGRGSILDAASVTLGGAVQVVAGEPEVIDAQLGTHWYRHNTGTPVVGTGAVVDHVRQHHSNDNALWQRFSKVSHALIDGLQRGQSVTAFIKENHRLLCIIGVVPTAVQTLVTAIEAHGGAAKICGAGAHRGDTAGQLLVYLPDNNAAALERHLGLSLEAVTMNPHGARCASD